MSKEIEQKYFEKLNINVLGIDKIKELIEENIINTLNCWNKEKYIEKQTFHIIGPAGVGKTQICDQISKSLTEKTKKIFETIIIKSPVLSRDDLIIPFPINENGTTKFKMLYSDFVPIDNNSFGIFVIDEFNRGDHNFQQLMWQVQNEYKLHLQDFPKGWFVISLDNPDDQEYSMNTLYDAAGLRRCLHVYVDVSVDAFLKHATKSKFHPLVIKFIQIHPEYLYDFDSQKIGSVYANPASWERVSNILWGYSYNDEIGEIKNNLFKIDSLISGLINSSMSRLFIDYIRDNNDIDPSMIYTDYDSVRDEILNLCKIQNYSKLSKIVNSFISYLIVNMPPIIGEYEKINSISKFFCDIPSDVGAIFITKVDSLDKKSNEFGYITKLHLELIKNSTEYKEIFYNSMAALGKRAKN